MRKFASKIFVTVFALAVSIFFSVQLYRFSEPEYKTELAEMHTSYTSITATGYVIRDEMLVRKPSGYGSACVYAVADGEKVARDAVLASFYSGESALAASVKSSELAERIGRLESSSGSSGLGTRELETIDRDINLLKNRISIYAGDGNGSRILSLESDLADLLTKKSAVMGDLSGYQAVVGELKSQLGASSVARTSNRVTAMESGYFSSFSDGYENVLTFDAVNTLSANDLSSLPVLKSSYGDDVIGKLVTNHLWYFACVVDDKALEGLAKGSSVTLRFPSAMDVSIPATVHRIMSEGDGTSTFILSSTVYFNELNYIRNQAVQIIVGTHKGLKVSVDSLRVQDDVTGVFIIKKSVIQFVPVKIIYTKDSYVLVSIETGDESKLLLYDEIIISGRDVYAGKITNY